MGSEMCIRDSTRGEVRYDLVINGADKFLQVEVALFDGNTDADMMLLIQGSGMLTEADFVL